MFRYHCSLSNVITDFYKGHPPVIINISVSNHLGTPYGSEHLGTRQAVPVRLEKFPSINSLISECRSDLMTSLSLSLTVSLAAATLTVPLSSNQFKSAVSTQKCYSSMAKGTILKYVQKLRSTNRKTDAAPPPPPPSHMPDSCRPDIAESTEQARTPRPQNHNPPAFQTQGDRRKRAPFPGDLQPPKPEKMKLQLLTCRNFVQYQVIAKKRQHIPNESN